MTFLPRELQSPERGAEPLSSGVKGAARSARTGETGETCQWIDGPATGDDACKCGRPVIDSLPGRAPYCPDHAQRCFESAAAWKARNAVVAVLDGSFAQISLKDWMGEQE